MKYKHLKKRTAFDQAFIDANRIVACEKLGGNLYIKLGRVTTQQDMDDLRARASKIDPQAEIEATRIAIAQQKVMELNHVR